MKKLLLLTLSLFVGLGIAFAFTYEWVIDDMEYANDAAAQAAYVSSDTVPSPVSQWKMNDNAANTTVVDSVGANNGVLTGAGNTSASSVAGKINTALTLDGLDAHVVVAGLNWTPTTVSIAWWLYPTSLADYNQSIMATAEWGAFIFHTTADGEIYVGTDLETRFTPADLPAGTLAVNTWHHFVYTYDGKQGRFYKNGSLLAGPKTQDSPDAWVGGFIIGVDRVDTIDGKVDDVRIYDYALTEKEIEAIYNNDSGTEEENPQNDLACFSEDTIKTQGSYSLKGVAVITDSLNDTLTRTLADNLDLSNSEAIEYDIYALRTGSNIKIGIHDSGGTTTEHTANVATSNTNQTESWDISGVSDANKDDIDSIIITIMNADAANTFYLDDIKWGVNAGGSWTFVN